MDQVKLVTLRNRIDQVLNEAITIYKLPFKASDVEVSFDLSGLCLGYAQLTFGKYRMRFNMEAYDKAPDEILNDTVPHEVAHLVCFANPLQGRKHDSGWKRVCQRLGGTGARTSDLELTSTRKSEEIKLRSTQHRRCQAGTTYLTRGRQHILAQHWEGYYQNKKAAMAPTSQPAPRVVVQGSSKRQLAEHIMHTNPTATRGQIIDMFVKQAGLTKAGAATYYYNIKNKK